MTFKRSNLLFWSLLLLYAALRFTLLGQKNLWFDEIYSWHITLTSFKDIIIQTAGDIHPPLFYFTLKTWNLLFGDSVISMRLLSVFFGIISFFFLYKISSKLTNYYNTILILLIYSLSPLNIYFSQEVRMSSMNLCLNIISTYLFLRITEFYLSGKITEKINYYVTAYVLITLYSLYTHYYSLFIFFSHILFIFIYNKRFNRKYIKQLILTFVVICLAYIPWVPVLFDQIRRGQSWRHEQAISDIIYSLVQFNNDIYLGFYHRAFLSEYFYIISGVTILLTAVILFLVFQKKNIKSYDPKYSLIFLTGTVPVIITIIISFEQWVEYFRYLSIIIPYIAVILIYKLNYVKNEIFKNSLIILIVIFHIIGIYLYFSEDSKNNDYREVMSYIQNNSLPDEKLYVYPHYYGWIVDFYSKKNAFQLPENIDYGWDKELFKNEMNNKKHSKFWLIVDNQTTDSSEHGYLIELIKSNYNLKDSVRYFMQPNTLDLLRFELNVNAQKLSFIKNE